jgi:hypothetical protein
MGEMLFCGLPAPFLLSAPGRRGTGLVDRGHTSFDRWVLSSRPRRTNLDGLLVKFCDDTSTSRDTAFAKIRSRVLGTPALAAEIIGGG